MKKTLSILSILFLFIAFQACEEEDEVQTPVVDNQYYAAANDINVLKEDAIQYIQEKVVSDSLIVFDVNTPEDALPKVGSIIVIPISEKTPYGFMGRVKSVNKEEKIKVFTANTPLDEAFETISVDTTFNLMDSFEGLYDEDGNPIEYELVDSIFSETPSIQAETRTGDFYLEDYILRFPIKLYKDKSGDTGIEVKGTAYLGFKSVKLDLEGKNHKINYVNFEGHPCAGLVFTNTVATSLGKGVKLEGRIGQIRFRPTFTIPVGPLPVPVVVPITLYLYGECGVKGEAQAKLSFKSEWSPQWKIQAKNGEWSTPANDEGNIVKKSPWSINGEFNVNAEVYSKAKLGALVGLYTATSGIGVNFCPTYSLSTNAKLSSELLKINPKVEQEIALNSDIYCVASFFGKKLGKLQMDFPKLILWSERMYLLPQFENFSAIGSSSSGEISYQIDQHYFLEGLGVTTGTTVFESDQTTEFSSYYPSPTNIDNKGFSYYNVSVDGLRSGISYYASPLVQLPFWDMKLYGDLHEFSTEASYNLGFRCVNQSYDVINFNFSLNNTTRNVIDYTTEAQDYNGGLMRVRITAKYNETTRTLDGIFDFFFYDDPGQKRQDGFSVSLANDDSGYVDCNKVVDNDGCYAALRISKSGTKAAQRQYTRALMEDDCNIGIFNKNYQK